MSANDLPFDPHTVVLATLVYGEPAIIHIAAEKGNLEAMKIILDRGEHVGLRLCDLKNVLLKAAMLGQDQILHFAIEYAKSKLDADSYYWFLNACDCENATPLSLAIKHGHITIVEMMLEYDQVVPIMTHQRSAGFHIFFQGYSDDSLRVNCFKTAIDHDQLYILRLLLHHFNPIPQHVNQLLLHAITQQNINMVQVLLLQVDADPNQYFCMQEAAKLGNISIMRLLIQHGANIYTTTIRDQQT